MVPVAVLNTSVATRELLQEVLEAEGSSAVTAYSVDFKRKHFDLAPFFQVHQLNAVLAASALPYAANEAFFQEHVLGVGHLLEHCFVLTTTNKRILEERMGSTRAIELVGHPFDVALIVAAMRAENSVVCTVLHPIPSRASQKPVAVVAYHRLVAPLVHPMMVMHGMQPSAKPIGSGIQSI